MATHVQGAQTADTLQASCCDCHWLGVWDVQEKANQEAAAAKAAASEDPLAPPRTQQRHEVRALCTGRLSGRLAVAYQRAQHTSSCSSCRQAALLPATAGRPPMLWSRHCNALPRRNLLRAQDFPPLPSDGQVMQRNEGRWDFTLQESEDGCVLARCGAADN